MDHLVAAAEVGVLAADGVEAVRAGGDDLGHLRLVQRRDVLLRLLLERVLVAHAPRGVAGAGLARPEDREVDARLLEQLGRRDRGLLRALVEGRGAADPEQNVRRRLAGLQHAHVEALGPLRAVALRPTPGIRCAVDVAQHRAGLLGKARLDHHQVAPQIHDVVDVLDPDRALPTHAPHVTQSQTTLSVTALGTSGWSVGRPSTRAPSVRRRAPGLAGP